MLPEGLWDSIKERFGDEVPHKLGDLEIALEDGLASLRIRYDKGRLVDQPVEITFADSGKVGSITGRVREEFWITARNPYFLLSPKYERFYISRDRETMKEYMAATLAYEVELENIKDAWERSVRDAEHEHIQANKNMGVLEKRLEVHDDDWTKAGVWDDKQVELHREKMDKAEKRIKEAREIMASSMPKIDSSYVIAVRTCGLDYVGLEAIGKAVTSKKAELVEALGVLPKTPTEIPLGDNLSLVVVWN